MVLEKHHHVADTVGNDVALFAVDVSFGVADPNIDDIPLVPDSVFQFVSRFIGH